MVTEYFVVSGLPHASMSWVKDMLAQYPGARVRANEFDIMSASANPVGEGVDAWNSSKASLIGTVSAPARHLLHELTLMYKPKWVFLWDDPLRQAYSCVLETGDTRIYEYDIKQIAAQAYGEMEVILADAERLQIPILHLHTGGLMSPMLFDRLARHLNVPPMTYKPVTTAPVKTTTYTPDKWSPELQDYVKRRLVSYLPRVRCALWEGISSGNGHLLTRPNRGSVVTS